jgi:cysteinyl-tRNA synthetase
VSLVLYDTKARAKRDFVPIDPERVGMYVCGPTVYDRAHIGNARPVIVFDVLYRLLRRIYGAAHVTYVRNITDIDDKINAAAAANNEPIAALTKRTTAVFHADMAALGALPPDEEPRATDHVAGMIEMTATLIARGHAYEAEGHVLFDVPSMAGYGALSGRSLKEMIAGARVDVAPYKKNPGDFILWKPSSGDLPGWDSPWGRGRPGWHLECSVMSEKFLSLPVDIHGGGQDLIFPHHENERAQSLCAHGIETFANYWMHNGFVNMGEKMSKSLGNILTVEQVLAEVGGKGEVARLLMLSTHYRKPLEWSSAGLVEARANMDRLYTALRGLNDVEADGDAMSDAVWSALSDDLNTSKAIAALYALATDANKASDAAERARLKGALLAGGELLGLLTHDPAAWFKGDENEDEIKIERLVTARSTARREGDFSEADRLRDELLAEQGVILEDRPDGTTDWKRL